ncbi:carnitine dehydratase [Alkalispirochaeta sphaeroplastigenens]|uniref:Carnitine dehydratase n=1 Tax=Alkalispirochaeta sphaeroplastigenens TaxID=1187066 RepID=A0A2S4JZ42_9SPIO|nr:CaiB/BaiF CoA-transferase family protein [Alkalispirochaeta sphaeroplastigenens]POR04784.1 carnitine dehydratase [Alkalispirochaeta sphaeroplastigenens]
MKSSKPLAGLKVLDMTRVLAGPYATMILSDLGAEVLKVEMPGTGDDSRHFGPFKNGRSLYFLSINRGKHSMTLNLKSNEGKDILRKLVARYDMLVENFRPGVMEKLGLGYEELKKINPGLIYAAASGYGHSGPESKKPAYDILAQAEGGLMGITGWPGGAPVRVGCSIGDITAGLFASIGILAALHQRNATGLGQKIDVAMLDCQVAILENALARYQATGENPEPLGNRHPTITPFQAYQARDDWFVVAMGNDNLWKTFCTATGRMDLAEDPRFATNPARTENLDELNALMEPLMAERTVQEWSDLLSEAGIPHAPINKVEHIMESPQILARKMLATVEDSLAGTVQVAGNPVKMSGFEDSTERPPLPELGEHTREVLSDLGYTDDQVRALQDQGVI